MTTHNPETFSPAKASRNKDGLPFALGNSAADAIVSDTEVPDSTDVPGWIDPSDPDYEVKWEERFCEELSSNLDEAREWIEENCSYRERLMALMFLVGQMDIREWLTLLGHFWCGLETGRVPFYEVVEVIREWLDDPFTVIPELMDAEEKAAFDALPEEITIYRGCGPENKGGFSWSLSREIAMTFPFNRGYWANPPLLLTATIKKGRAAALKLKGNEQEVLVIDLSESAWTEEIITEPPPPK